MKSISYLLAAFFLYLACYPCTDELNCTEDSVMLEEVITIGDDCSGEMELCSPFCICSCCSHLNQPESFFFEAFAPTYNSQNFPCVYTLIPTLTHAIWQPPKV